MPDASDRPASKSGPVRQRRDIRTALALATAVLVGTARLPAQTAVTVPPPECQTSNDRIAVLLVGSYHMANPGLDRFNLEADDVLTPRRQAEIEAVISRLATFRPTKVAIEAPYGSQSVASAYREYVRDARALRRNESEQIGFRLARHAGHAAIYPIDVQAPFDDAGVRALAETNPSHGRRMKDLTVFGQTVMAGMADTLAKGTIGDMLAAMNRPDTLRAAHWPYVRYYAPIVEGDHAQAQTWSQAGMGATSASSPTSIALLRRTIESWSSTARGTFRYFGTSLARRRSSVVPTRWRFWALHHENPILSGPVSPGRPMAPESRTGAS